MIVEIARGADVAPARYDVAQIPGREARALLRRLIAVAGASVMEVVGAFALAEVLGRLPSADSVRAAWASLPAVLASEEAWAWVEAMCAYASTPDGRRLSGDVLDVETAGRPWEPVDVALEVAKRNGFFSPRGFSVESVKPSPASP